MANPLKSTGPDEGSDDDGDKTDDEMLPKVDVAERKPMKKDRKGTVGIINIDSVRE